MSGGVFICYRREETAFAARAIHDRVVQRLERDNVFLDVDNIDLGVDWFNVLTDRVGACDALVAVIGRNWVSSADKDSLRRLDDPDDFVRIEIEAALQRNVRVIPVLVDGAAMPKASELPESLKGLARRQGTVVSHAGFEADVEKLTHALASILEARRSREAAELEAAHRADEERQTGEAAEADRIVREERGRAEATEAARVEAKKAHKAEEERKKRAAAETAIETGNNYVRVGDYAQAITWFRKAADQGDALAQRLIGYLYEEGGHGVQQDYAQAMAWHRKAADQGDATSQNWLGLLYSNGQGTRQDYAQAMVWLRKAADQGDTLAQFNVGLLYQNGWGVKQDYSQAMAWFRKAADGGSVDAENNIGVLYLNGRGVNKNIDQAKIWLQRAADHGSPEAEENLRNLSGWRRVFY
jgi:hypothetical protein